MIDRTHALTVKRQAELLGIGRSTVYYRPEPIPEAAPRLMRRIDELHLQHPFAGSRTQRDLLRCEGVEIGRRHVATLMRRIGIEPIYRKPNTSRKHPAPPLYPYLLRGLAIERSNQVWAMEITYIPMARSFVYLTRSWTGTAARCWRTTSRSRCRPTSASRRCARRSPATEPSRS
jgi:putative transposase